MTPPPHPRLLTHWHCAGYKSVAHYLVLNNLTDAAKLVALEREMCPPELAGALAAATAWAGAAGVSRCLQGSLGLQPLRIPCLWC